MCDLIDDLTKGKNFTQNDLNNIYAEIESVVHNSAIKCGAMKITTRREVKHRKQHQPWWTHEC